MGYIVYKHTSPSEKVYIGITSRTTKERWGNNGIGYKACPYFWRAIQKYGWDNIKHEILYEDLTQEEACEMEIKSTCIAGRIPSAYGYVWKLKGETNG